MNGWLVALVLLIPLMAFGMWLVFNAILVRWYGLEALKMTPAVYRIFKPREWNEQPGDAIRKNLP